jgi:hypothetical protein
MEIKSPYYSQYIGDRMTDIPREYLREIIDEFAINARFFMSSETDSDTMNKINAAVVDLLKDKFKNLTLNLVTEAYSRGSLGELGGTTRFTVRNVYIWLSNVDEKSQRLYQERISRLDSEKRAAEEKAFKSQQKRSNMYGSAMMWKIGIAKQISSAEYDRLTLDRIVDAMQKGYDLKTLTPEMIL